MQLTTDYTANQPAMQLTEREAEVVVKALELAHRTLVDVMCTIGGQELPGSVRELVNDFAALKGKAQIAVSIRRMLTKAEGA